MTGPTVVPLPSDSTGRVRVAEELERLTERAKRGELTGFVLVGLHDGSVVYSKMNLTHLEVLGLLDRASHYVNREWDSYSGGAA